MKSQLSDELVSQINHQNDQEKLSRSVLIKNLPIGYNLHQILSLLEEIGDIIEHQANQSEIIVVYASTVLKEICMLFNGLRIFNHIQLQIEDPFKLKNNTDNIENQSLRLSIIDKVLSQTSNRESLQDNNEDSFRFNAQSLRVSLINDLDSNKNENNHDDIIVLKPTKDDNCIISEAINSTIEEQKDDDQLRFDYPLGKHKDWNWMHVHYEKREYIPNVLNFSKFPSHIYTEENIITLNEHDNKIIKQNLIIDNEDHRIAAYNVDMKLFPFTTFVRLNITMHGNIYFGSGTLVGPRHILTARHNCYNSESKSWADKIEVFTYKSTIGYKVISVFTFDPKYDYEDDDEIENIDNNIISYNHDIALLILDNDLGNERGWMSMIGYHNYEEYLLRTVDKSIIVGGYQQDNFHKKRFEFLYAQGKPDKVRNISIHGVILYAIDTTAGQSGGPVWVRYSGGPPDFLVHSYLIGVHNAGYKEEGNNLGSAITMEKLDLLIKSIDMTYNIT